MRPLGNSPLRSAPSAAPAASRRRRHPPALSTRAVVLLTAVAAIWLTPLAAGLQPADLRLVPFPKEVRLEAGVFRLDRPLALEAGAADAKLLHELLAEEVQRAGIKPPALRVSRTPGFVLRLSAGRRAKPPAPPAWPDRGPEQYSLTVRPEEIVIAAPGPAGLFYGVQTLRQLVRANLQDDGLPCLTITDWPSLRWRAFQDDLTRGPSSTLEELEREATLGAGFKLNLFTYYMEHQFRFRKHPAIGPPEGALTPEELQALVAFARPLRLDILGNQQSFGHFTAILAHPEYAALRETPYLLCPTNPRTYELLDDLYGEVIPLLPLPFFNVCCDETDGLGDGPSKPLAQQIGVGGLYVQHIKRLHELVHGKYGKRMMMWGDIILRHPDHLKDIPKDTIMLSWGYDPRASFEDQIVPFAKSGFEFLVCPGVNCWNRVLPHFGAAQTNIRNFVRDGAKHEAIGMLNTAWDDDGENFNAPNWHGAAWGAECAWNAAATAPADFNRRIGGVLFGERGERFGQAINTLAESKVDGLPNASFWKLELAFPPGADPEAGRATWEALLRPTRAALEHLLGCQKDALVNAGLLDFFIFGVRRLELYAQRELDRIEAAGAYRAAAKGPPAQALEPLTKAAAALRRPRDTHAALAERFAELWRRENKPYALDWTLARYRDAIAKYDAALAKLAAAQASARAGQPIPSPADAGL